MISSGAVVQYPFWRSASPWPVQAPGEHGMASRESPSSRASHSRQSRAASLARRCAKSVDARSDRLVPAPPSWDRSAVSDSQVSIPPDRGWAKSSGMSVNTFSQELLLDWAELYRGELLENWGLCAGKQQPRKIAPLF